MDVDTQGQLLPVMLSGVLLPEIATLGQQRLALGRRRGLVFSSADFVEGDFAIST